MAAAQDVHVRICNQEIVKFDLEVKALIQDIRDCSGPLSALTELNTKVKEKFQQLRHRIQELEQSAKEQDKESEKQVLLQEVENHKKQMLRKTAKESLAQTSSAITESLMGISRMMSQQVQQSEEAMQTLDFCDTSPQLPLPRLLRSVFYYEELMLLNCGVGEDSSESLGLQGDPTSPS
uniref:BCL2 interacting protein 1 n=1 Tax=Bos mutus grunniens TaxID=30521 RepID=A0A8B9XHX4_BOSMU